MNLLSIFFSVPAFNDKKHTVVTSLLLPLLLKLVKTLKITNQKILKETAETAEVRGWSFSRAEDVAVPQAAFRMWARRVEFGS